MAPIRSAGIKDTLKRLTLLGGDLNAHSPLWDTNQPRDTRGEQLEDWVIAYSASALNYGTAALLNHTTGGLSSPDVPLARPSLADKAEWTPSADGLCSQTEWNI